MDKDIFDLAIAKKLFGGGGGKREGTAIPADGTVVEKIYFNTENTVEETNAILSQLTYITTPLMDWPMCALYANTADGNKGSFIVAEKVTINGGTGYVLCEIINIANKTAWDFYKGDTTRDFNGWYSISKAGLTSESVGCNCMAVFSGGQSLTDFSGIPVGAENEKIKNVLSITPF